MQDPKARIVPLILIALLLLVSLPAGNALTLNPSDSMPSLSPPPALRADGPAGDPLPFAPDAELWQTECVDCPPQIQGFGDRGLRLDSSGRPHIAYAGDRVYYARYDGLAWQIEVVEDVEDTAYGVSLALDAADRPHLTYSDWVSKTLKYAWHDGTSWHIEIVDGVTDIGAQSSLALDGAGRPHIGYLGSTTDDLKYAWQDGTIWHVETVDSAGNIHRWPSMALDTSGRPHISYYSSGSYGTGDESLKYAWFDGSAWHVETVDSGAGVGEYSSLALDSSERI